MSELDRVLAEVGWFPFGSNDADFVRELFFELRAPMFEPLGLPPATIQAMLDQQLRARTIGYEQQYPSAATYVRPGVGAAILSSGESILVVDVTICASERGKGYGTEMFETLFSLGLPVTLTVEEGNAARTLYARLGFREVEQIGFHLHMRRDPV